jgi:misacylated tRNA(Ala) deacylase
MAVYLCHEFPELYEHDARVIDSATGRVLLDRSAFHPGGGGQVSDTGWIEYGGGVVAVTGIETVPTETGDDEVWHLLGDEVELSGQVQLRVDADRRSRVAQLHTDSHILNALVFEQFPGTLVTGAQINADGSGRMDFDLSQVDNDVLRGLDVELNAIIARGVDVRSTYVDAAEASTTDGLVRSLSVAPPPTPDGTLRIIEIDGVDRQACGGTHLSNTAQSGPVRITKVENKGKRNRRIRFELV